MNDISPKPVATMETVISHHAPPTVMSHFKMREKISRLAEKRYTAPPQLAGLKLKSVVGYDGMGRNNMIWHPVTGKINLKIRRVQEKYTDLVGYSDLNLTSIIG